MATTLTPLEKSFTAVIPFQKDVIISEEERIIEGYATTGSLDRQDQIVSQKAVAEGLKPYLKYPTIRVNHLHPPVGKTVQHLMDSNGLAIQVQIGKNIQACDDAWEGIKQGLYTGFSVGGAILGTKTVYNKPLGKNILTITKLKINEISITDAPANVDCFFSMLKSLRKEISKGGDIMTDDNPEETSEEETEPEENVERIAKLEKTVQALLKKIEEPEESEDPKDPKDPKPEEDKERTKLIKELSAEIQKNLGLQTSDTPNRGAHQDPPSDPTPPPEPEIYSLRKAIVRNYKGIPPEGN